MGVSIPTVTVSGTLTSSFLLAFGVHLNILCVIAQLLLLRQEIMDSPSYGCRHN
jgi:hypothetical protein